jgi:Tfp pilus assembly protein PilP
MKRKLWRVADRLTGHFRPLTIASVASFFFLLTSSFAQQKVLRDPFRPPSLTGSVKKFKSGLQAGAVEEYRLVGIIWSGKQLRAMVEDKAGIGYILQRGMTIGADGGRVKEIYQDRIVIEENPQDKPGLIRSREVVLTLPAP